ncbi:translocation/assembly module TamB domain-containing protein [Neptunomonas japonica]|uniref:translocation/assembly module TamB domain-containing protein n=1 Tax=Neptunomonas japonica TaxID=417574 RepID=UPI0003FE0F07|nr:translocation/assembly module TamB domain-containing protein [Neptunomonas japonica]
MKLIYKRLAWGVLATFSVFVALFLAAFIYFGVTTQGLQQLISLGQRWLPGELQIEYVEGTLLDKVSLRSVSYQDESMDVSFRQLQWVWSPKALLSGLIDVQSISLEHPVITLHASTAEAASVEPPTKSLLPLSMPDIVLPLQLRIENLQLKQLVLNQAKKTNQAESEPILIHYLKLTMHSAEKAVIVDELRFMAQQGLLQLDAQVAGKVQPQGAYPFLLSTQWKVQQPEKKALEGRGTLSGGLTKLAMQQQLSGMFDGAVTLLLRLSADTLFVDELQIMQAGDEAGTGAGVFLSGEVSDLQKTATIAIDGRWENVNYPLQGDAVYSSKRGKVKLSGNIGNYHLRLDSELVGLSVPEGRWVLEADGNTQGFSAFTLQGDTLEGQLLGNGNVVWLPSLSWQLDIKGEQVNPGSQWEEWPAKLDFLLSSSGSLQASGGVQLKADLTSLQGTLRNQPIEGNAGVSLAGSELTIKQLQLNVANAQLQATGVAGQQMNLKWLLNAPSLASVLPNAEGYLTGNGTLHGPLDQLQLIANLKGSGLKFESYQLDKLDAGLDIDLSAQRRSNVLVKAANLSLAGQRWQSLLIEGEGTPLQHQLTMALEQGPADVTLQAKGQWENLQWSGSLTQTDLQNELMGTWQLLHTVSVTGSADEATLDDFCLQRIPNDAAGSDQICVTTEWSKKNGSQGRFNVSQLALSLFEPLLPTGTYAAGEVHGQGTFQQRNGEKPDFSASINVVASQLHLEDTNLSVKAGDLRLLLSGKQSRIKADLLLPLIQPVGQVEASIVVDDAYGEGKLTGSLQAALSDLVFVSLFSPELQAVKGQVESKLALRGSLKKPQVKGYLKLQEGRAELPALGITLDAINLEVHDQPATDQLRLSGSLDSGKGALALSGVLDPLNYSGQIKLEGKDFQLTATNAIQAWVSPDLSLSITPELVSVRGEIKIPKAQLSPPKVTSTTPLSSDVVIVGSNSVRAAPVPVKQALDAQVRITLGDKVEVDAVGFQGRLEGSVLVEDDGRRATRATGSMAVAAGKYRLYGQDLNIERGSLVFSGGPVDNPGLDLRVSRIVEEVTAGAKVSGTLKEPRLTLFSEPSMPESSLLSYLLFGRAPGAASSSASEQELLFRAASALTLKGGNVIAEKLSDLFDVNELGLEGDSLNDTSFYIGKYLSPKLYVKYGVGILEPTSTFFMRYLLSKRWSIESQTGTNSSGGDIIYTFEH